MSVAEGVALAILGAAVGFRDAMLTRRIKRLETVIAGLGLEVLRLKMKATFEQQLMAHTHRN